MAFVGVTELLEGVAEAARSVSGPTFGVVVATVGQIILVGHGDVGSRENKRLKEKEVRETRMPAERGTVFKCAPLPSHDGNVAV